MIAMQYNVKLPSDYDMSIIKNRVKNNGYKTDGFLDLSMKAYLIAEFGKHGNIQNEYAPFYLWKGAEGMNHFLLDGPFNNILNSFGWTPVNTWVVLHQKIEKHDSKQYAVITKLPVLPRLDFSDLQDKAKRIFDTDCNNASTTCSIVAYNPTTWQLCHFLLSADSQEMEHRATGTSLVYQLLHLS